MQLLDKLAVLADAAKYDASALTAHFRSTKGEKPVNHPSSVNPLRSPYSSAR